MIPYSNQNAGELHFKLSGSHDIIDNPTIMYNRDQCDFSGLGTIRGQVQESGEGLPGFVRLVYNNPGKYADGVTVKETKTSTLGTYEFNDINEGLRYDVIASLDGWQKRVLTNIQPFAAMAEPKQVKATFVISENRIAIAWKNRKPVDSIKIYRSETIFDYSSLPQPLSILPGDALGFDDVSIEDNTTYFYMVENIGGGISLYSSIVSVSVYEIDEFWDNVSLLMHFDNNSVDQIGNTFRTDGTISYIPTSNMFNTALQPTAWASGLYSEASVSGFELGAGDFTIEFRCKMPTTTTTDSIALSAFDVAPATGWNIYFTPAKRIARYTYNSYGIVDLSLDATNIFDNEWHSVAFVRKNGVLSCFIDGNSVGSGSLPHTYSMHNIILSICYQKQGSARYGFNGAIDELRITKGIARYESNYIVRDKPFPNQGA